MSELSGSRRGFLKWALGTTAAAALGGLAYREYGTRRSGRYFFDRVIEIVKAKYPIGPSKIWEWGKNNFLFRGYTHQEH